MSGGVKRSASDKFDTRSKSIKLEKNSFNNKNFVKGERNTKAGKPNFGKDSSFGKFNQNKPGGFAGKKFVKSEGASGKFSKNRDVDAPDGNGEAPQQTSEKPDWNKFKQAKKDLKLKRKGGKDLFEVITQAKQIYEQLKCKTTPDKDKLCKELHGLIGDGNSYQKLVLAHDTARIVQCLLKTAPATIRREVSENLIPIISQIATSKYAHFCVSRMIKYGTPDIKQKVVQGMMGKIAKLINYGTSSSIIDTIYISWASSQQKANMRQELYGDLYKMSKDSSVKCIADTYKNSPHMKAAILNAVKTNLNHVVNKKLVDNSLVHDVLLDFLNECNEEDRNEIIAAYAPFIPSLASTKSGVRAAIICFWHSIVKERRAILKNLKEHLIKLCTHEYGHILIIAIINSVDDTKALKKSIFDPIFGELETIACSEWGRRIIQWFVAPEDTTYFHPQIISFLEQGLKFSKKDKEVRRTELLEAVEQPLCEAIAENPKFWLRGGHTGLATVAILKNCKGDNLKKAFNALADVMCRVDWQVLVKEVDETNDTKIGSSDPTTAVTENLKKKKKIVIKKEKEVEEETAANADEELMLGVEHPGLHLILKKILKLRKFDSDSVKFSSFVAEKLTDETVKKWLTLNRASYLLLNAYENAAPATQQKLKELIAVHKPLLNKQIHSAAKILLKNLEL